MATMVTTITVPTAKAADILDTVSAYFGWTPALGITKKQLIDQNIRNFIANAYESNKVETQVNSARNTALQEVQAVEITV